MKFTCTRNILPRKLLALYLFSITSVLYFLVPLVTPAWISEPMSDLRIVRDKGYRESVESTIFISILCVVAYSMQAWAIVRRSLVGLSGAFGALGVVGREGGWAELRARLCVSELASRAVKRELRAFANLTLCLLSIRLTLLVLPGCSGCMRYLHPQVVRPVEFESIRGFLLQTQDFRPRMRITVDGDLLSK